MKFYKIINGLGYVLSNEICESGKSLFGYGGVWCKDHRKAKRFKTLKEVQKEINKTNYPKGTKFLVVTNNENWKPIYRNYKKKGLL